LAQDKIYSAKEHSAIAWATEHHMTRVYQDSVAQSRQALQTEMQQRKTLQAISVGTTIGLVLLAILAIVLYRARQRARRDAAYIQQLNQEVHHRTKNNLQMLNNLLSLQMDRQPEGGAVHQALDSTKTRVAAISRLHHLLYSEGELTRIPLPELVQSLVPRSAECLGSGNRRGPDSDRSFAGADPSRAGGSPHPHSERMAHQCL
jgi:two-component sensor histidine kinase